MNIVIQDDNQKHKTRFQMKNEIRKLKSQNKRIFKLIKFCNKDYSIYKNTFDDEILLYEELLEELMCTKELLNIAILKNIEKIDNYTKLLSSR